MLDLFGCSVDLLLALLSTATKTENQVKSRLLLDVVVGKSAAVFELLAGEDQALLVRWDTFLVLDFGLDIVDCVGRFHLEGDGLPGQGLDEDLHAAYEPECQQHGYLQVEHDEPTWTTAVVFLNSMKMGLVEERNSKRRNRNCAEIYSYRKALKLSE